MKTPKLKKPTLKRPSGDSSGLKPPKLVADLYSDLRDRRLLPLIAVLAVAIVAVPFLLADKSEPEQPFVPAPSGATPTAASFSVVPAKPQLRDYRKRLQHRKHESPFSTYAAMRASNETREAVEGVLDGTESGGGTETATVETAPTSGATEAPAPEYVPTQPPPIDATVEANVGVEAVVKIGFVGSDESKLKEASLPSQTKLPNVKNPAIVYTGPSKDGRGALFLMSADISAYYGHGKCVLGGAICQVLEVRPGKSATFAIGYGETRYKVSVLGFAPIVKERKIHIEG